MPLPGSAAPAIRRHRLAMALCLFFVLFLILFPKGGIKVGNIPLTWGYLFLGLSMPALLLVRLVSLPLRFPPRLVAALAMLLPFQVLFIYAALACGIGILGYFVSSATTLFFMPLVFLLIYPSFYPVINGHRLGRYISWSIFIAAVWGIFLFFLHPIIGRFIEVPYLTVNAADYGQIELTKHIFRGVFPKLISTYNNGNVYGAATLILLPLFYRLEPSGFRRLTLKLALLLTLSRTVWAGLIVNELIELAVQLGRQLGTFPVIRLRKLAGRLITVAVTVVLVGASVLFIKSGGEILDFLFDPTLGGRAGEVAFHRITLLPSQPVGTFAEVVYATALQDYGVLGLIAFTLFMVSPLLLLFVDRSALRSPMRSAALQGLVLYAIIALSDGAFDLIPVMVFYWFAYMVYLFGWPAGERPSHASGQTALAPGLAEPPLPQFGAGSSVTA